MIVYKLLILDTLMSIRNSFIYITAITSESVVLHDVLIKLQAHNYNTERNTYLNRERNVSCATDTVLHDIYS